MPASNCSSDNEGSRVSRQTPQGMSLHSPHSPHPFFAQQAKIGQALPAGAWNTLPFASLQPSQTFLYSGH